MGLVEINDPADKLRGLPTGNQNLSLHDNSAFRKQIVKDATTKRTHAKPSTTAVSKSHQSPPILGGSSTPVTYQDPNLLAPS